MAHDFMQLPAIEISLDTQGMLREFPALLAGVAIEYGPIFRCIFPTGLQRVYMVGPQANRFVLHTHR